MAPLPNAIDRRVAPAPTVMRGRALRPELQIIVACGPATLDAAAHASLAQLLTTSVDWEAVGREAVKHALVPLVHRHLRTVPAGLVPPEILARLGQRAADIARANLRLVAELRRIVQALDVEGLSPVVIKGPVLAQAAYGSLALRTFLDLDLLLHPRDLPHAARVLLTLGYDGYQPHWETHKELNLRAAYDYGLVSPATGIRVEVHHRLARPCFQSVAQLEQVLARATTATVAGTTVRALSPEDQFVFLCVHGAMHIWERLEWLCAVAELVRGGGIADWDVVAARAREGSSDRLLAIALLLAESVAGVPVPEALAASVARDQRARVLAEHAVRRLQRAAPTVGGSERFIYGMRARGWRDRARYCAFALTTPTLADVAAIQLPRSLHALYPVLRPPRIVATYAASVVRALVARS